MRKSLRLLRRRYWPTVWVATLFPAALAGIFEYMMSGGASGVVPLSAGLLSGVITAFVLLLIQGHESKPVDRVFSQRSASELVELIDGLTDIAAKPIVDRHTGTWMRVPDLPVYNIAMSDDVVLVDDIPSYARPGISLSFDKKEWVEKLKALDRGDKINVIGRIHNISEDILWLEKCEIVDGNEPV